MNATHTTWEALLISAAYENGNITPTLTDADHDLLLVMVEAMASHYGLKPHDIRRYPTSLGFTLSSVSGGTRECWATWDELTVGGRGVMAGSLAEAVSDLCMDMV